MKNIIFKAISLLLFTCPFLAYSMLNTDYSIPNTDMSLKASEKSYPVSHVVLSNKDDGTAICFFSAVQNPSAVPAGFQVAKKETDIQSNLPECDQNVIHQLQMHSQNFLLLDENDPIQTAALPLVPIGLCAGGAALGYLGAKAYTNYLKYLSSKFQGTTSDYFGAKELSLGFLVGNSFLPLAMVSILFDYYKTSLVGLCAIASSHFSMLYVYLSEKKAE